MSSEWPVVRLGDVCEILDSKRKPVTKSERVPGDIPYYGASGVQDYVADYLFDEPLVLLGEDGAKWRAGDVSAFMISGKSWVNNHAHVLRPMRELVLDEWLTHFLVSSDLSDFITGVTVPKLNQAKMREIEIPLPPIDEQKRIVSKLDEAMGYVDELADVQKQLVSAQGTFWTKALSGKFADQQMQTIDSSKAPSSLVKLGDVAKLIRGPFGGSITKAMFVEEGFAVYEQQHAIGNQFAEFRYFVNATKFEELNRFEVRPGHLIMSCAGTIGRVAEVPESAPRGIINQALMKIVPSEELDSTYLRLYLSGSVFQDQLDEGAKGSALKNAASVSDLRELLIPLPSLDEQRKIVSELLNLKSDNDQAASSARSKLSEIIRLRSSILAAAFAGDL